MWGEQVYMQDDLTEAERAKRRTALGRLGLCEVSCKRRGRLTQRAPPERPSRSPRAWRWRLRKAP